MKKLYFIILFSFIAVFANAQTCWWVKSFGEPNDQAGTSIVVDNDGNVYTFGYFRGTIDFDPGPGVQNLTSGWYAAFISKLDKSGNYIWAKEIGRAVNLYGNSNSHAITLDAQANIYITGTFQDTCDFDPGSGVFKMAAAPYANSLYFAYVCKLDSSGSLIWAKSMGKTGTTQAMDIAVDGLGNVYTTGAFNGTTDFNPDTASAATFNLTTNIPGTSDIFISKLNRAYPF